jgi:hypothetical protein
MLRTVILAALAAFPALGQSPPSPPIGNPPAPQAPPKPVAGGAPRAGHLEPRALDLSRDTARQFVVDRVPGERLGHTTSVLLGDGKTLLVAYTRGPSYGPIQLRRSEDGGKTWSSRATTPASWRTCRDAPTLHRVVDAQGTSRLLLFTGMYPIRVSRSEDDGATWTELEPVGDFGGLTAMSSIERLRDGTHLGFFHDDGRFLSGKGVTLDAPRFIVFQSLSKDGGLSWSAPVKVAQHAAADLAEPCAIRSPDGKEISLVLRENRRQRGSALCSTKDEGVTWTEAHEIRLAVTGDRHVARYAPDGRLLIAFRDMAPGSATHGDWVCWVGTYADLANNYPGQYRVRLMDNAEGADCGYGGVALLSDGTFALTSYGHWDASVKAEAHVVCVRLTLTELDELSKAR